MARATRWWRPRRRPWPASPPRTCTPWPCRPTSSASGSAWRRRVWTDPATVWSIRGPMRPPIDQTVVSGQGIEHVPGDPLDGLVPATEEAGPVGGPRGEDRAAPAEQAHGGGPVAHPPPAGL